MTGTGLDSLPGYVRKTLADLDRKDASDQAKIKEIQEAIRNRKETKFKVIYEYNPDHPGTPRPDPAKSGQDPAECPLTQEQMLEIGNRRRIIIAIALASPDRRVKPTLATKWMSAAGIFVTPPENAAKSLSRYMRRHPEIWEPLERGWFRLVGTPDPDIALPATTQADSTDTEEDQEEPTGSAQHESETSNLDDNASLS